MRERKREGETWVHWWCLLTLFTQLQLYKVEKKKIDFVGQMFVNRNSGESTSSLSLYITAFIFIFTFFIFISLGGDQSELQEEAELTIYLLNVLLQNVLQWKMKLKLKHFDWLSIPGIIQTKPKWLALSFFNLKTKGKGKFQDDLCWVKFSHPALLLSLCYDHVLIYRVIFFSITL